MSKPAAWCDKHMMNHWTLYDCGRMNDNDERLNGHRAAACPVGVDISMYGDAPHKRYAHGDCMPKKPQISDDEQTLTWTVGNTEYSVRGYLDSIEVSGMPESTVRAVIVGKTEMRTVHSDPHFGPDKSKHKFCNCLCALCHSSMNNTCICKECDCGR